MFCPFANNDCIKTECSLWVQSIITGGRCALAQIAVALEEVQEQIAQINDKV